METTRLEGFEVINIRSLLEKLDPEYSSSFILSTRPLQYAEFVAQEWLENNPNAHVVMEVTPSAVVVEGSGRELLFRQDYFSDSDTKWYLSKMGVHASEKLLAVLNNNLALLPKVLRVLPVFDYFLSSLESGQRMKKSAYIVQECIEVAIANRNVIFPIAVHSFIDNETPSYGLWTEQHIDKFYRVLRES